MMFDVLFFLTFFFFFILAIKLALKFNKEERTIAFFHPYCNACGGGERVLWCAINSFQERFASKNLKFVVYTGDIDSSPLEIVTKVEKNFGISLDSNKIQFIFLKWRRLLEADLYPRFTLFFQLFAGLILGFEALFRLNPSIYIDTTGHPLTLPLFKLLGGCRVICYIHYPVISSDMISLVESQKMTFNNSNFIATNRSMSRLKLYYYRFLVLIYKLCGKTVDLCCANSTWTFEHLFELWSRNDINIIYPPCDVISFDKIIPKAENLLENDKLVKILSIGQIRPEKNHRLQLESLALLKEMLTNSNNSVEIRLVIVGGCRNEGDLNRVEILKEYARDLNVENELDWRLNVPLEELKNEMSTCLIGIHTMFNEHFGISVVESMAGGNLMIANESGGPKSDIIRLKKVGFLAKNGQDYADKMMQIIEMNKEERSAIRILAKEEMKKFDQCHFEEHFFRLLEPFVN